MIFFQATCSKDGTVRIYEAPDIMNLSHWQLQVSGCSFNDLLHTYSEKKKQFSHATESKLSSKKTLYLHYIQNTIQSHPTPSLISLSM